MKHTLAWLLAFALLLPPFACAGPLAGYQTLIVGGFSADEAQVANVQPDTEEKFNQIRDKMVEKLAESLATQLQGSFPEIRRQGEGDTGNAVIVRGSFTAIDAGRRGLRMYIGFSGTASATLRAEAVDGGSGKVLAVFEQGHSAPLGWAGSEMVLLQITDRLAGDLTEFLKQLR